MIHSLRLIATLLLGITFALTGTVALAQDASPEASDGAEAGMPQMHPETCSVVAEGLIDPRYVAVGEDGTVYVTEAGFGGEDTIEAPAADEEASPESTEGGEEGPPQDGPIVARGPSGQITAIAPDGTQSVLVSGLPSYGGVGAAGIVDTGDTLWVAVGGEAGGAAFFSGLEIDPLEYENTIISIDKASGEITVVAELGSYEIENNPDGGDINPNLYGMTLGPDGLLYVADAGGNTIYTVNPEDGSFELIAVIPTMEELMGAEAPEDPMMARQSVPLQPAFDANGTLHVVLLSEGWEAPSIVTIAEDGTVTGIGEPGMFMFGLTASPDGTLYLTQGTTDFSGEMPEPGFVSRVAEDGSLTPIVEGLFVPHGTAVDADGNVFVTVMSIAFGPGEPAGMLVKCEGAAA